MTVDNATILLLLQILQSVLLRLFLRWCSLRCWFPSSSSFHSGYRTEPAPCCRCQSPADAIVTWDGQRMLEEVSLCFCKCFVTLIHVVGDGIRFIYHLCKFFVGSQQVFVGRGFFGQVVDIVVGGAVVSIVIAVPLLTQVVR